MKANTISPAASSTRSVDWTKPIQTRNGRVVKRLFPYNGHNYSFIGIIARDDGFEDACHYNIKGKWLGNGDDRNHESDIINVPEKKVRAKVYAMDKFHIAYKPGLFPDELRDTIYTFTCEMMESEAKKRGLVYEVIT